MNDGREDSFARRNRSLDAAAKLADTAPEPDERAPLRRFVELFYAHASHEEIAGQTPATLFAVARRMWRMSVRRKPGEALVEAFNPRFAEDGWPTPHSAIAIVNDDMPFLVDSITGGLSTTHRLRIHIVHHPILIVERDAGGVRKSVVGTIDFERGKEQERGRESFMYLEVDARSDPAELERLRKLILDILADVRVAVADWREIIDRTLEGASVFKASAAPVDDERRAETVAFLRWLVDDNFTFLGYREYRFAGTPESGEFVAVEGTGLGILRDADRFILRGVDGLTSISAEIRHFLTLPGQPLIITKANVKATVHRPVHMDYVGIKIYDSKGGIIGERRIVGLFTSQAASRSCYEIPILRRKVEGVQRRALFDRRSHAGKSLRHILETFPRDELFQIDEDDLLRTALGILHLIERPRPRAFLRRDRFERFVSALVYVPRDAYQSGIRSTIADILCEAFNGEVSVYYAQLSDDVLARWHFIIRTRPGEVPEVDEAAIDRAITEAVRGWDESLRERLVEVHGEEEGLRLFLDYGGLFSLSYQKVFDPGGALYDIAALDRLDGPEAVGFDLYRGKDDPENALRLKIYHVSQIVPLSDCLPMLENLGLRVISEDAYRLERREGGCIHDFFLHVARGTAAGMAAVKPVLEELLTRIWSGEAENDMLNGLAVLAGLDWRQIVILRACGRYLRQLALPFGQAYMSDCLLANPAISRHLVALFETRFDPGFKGDAAAREAACRKIVGTIGTALDAVSSLDQDRILRAHLGLVMAIVRTNYYRPDAPALAFKILSREIEDMPLPRPWREIFVYSPRVEGIHLRWGPVARGGLRWSDRRQDFRTEVLGLVKAQQVKNAVIVPVGAKGGFVPKNLPDPSDREAFQAEGIAAYRIFVSSLLGLTDNLVDGEVRPPEGIVRHDEDDPYLVVAADKGTATFSDIANAIALERGFWLGDAFASGGSHGYDHKAMGITARGAWVSVQRHFREAGIDVQKDPVRVIGVGDMSGDVFGNGVLLSKSLRLVAAFDHRHIFLDPDPDPKRSHAERKRLFGLARSSWADYDTALISPGGGVWSRTLKSIPLSPEIRALLGVEATSMAPARLINAILKAPADLLWFGGIGTYVKASGESHGEVGDRGNDGLRIDAAELAVKVIGEGANLGMTQRARIEFARRGGRLNTDFIDNSAGVDTSDKEVNIKILLAGANEQEALEAGQRDALLVEMTKEVAAIVLADNYLQTQAISLAEAQAAKARESHVGLIRTLEREGTLDRAIEFLPDEEAISELALAGKGLSRPELAVLMAYAKLSLKAILLNGTAIDDPVLLPELAMSFPASLRERFPKAMQGHRLRRELVATVLVNQIINRAGLAFVYEVREETGLGVDHIAAAYLLTRDVFGLEAIWQAIDRLDYKVPATIQTLMHLEIADFLKQQTIWFLRNEGRPFDIPALVEGYGDGVAELLARPEAVLSPLTLASFETRVGMFEEQGVPRTLARKVAGIQALVFACDLEQVADALGRPVVEVGRAYAEVGHLVGFDWLRQTGATVPVDDHWDRLAARAVLDDLNDQQREAARHILSALPDLAAGDAVSAWLDGQELTRIRAERLLAELKSSGPMTVAKLSFAARHMRSILARAISD